MTSVANATSNRRGVTAGLPSVKSISGIQSGGAIVCSTTAANPAIASAMMTSTLCLCVGDEAFEGARAVDQRHSRHANKIFDTEVVALEDAGRSAFDVAAPVPSVVRIFLRRRPVAGRPGYFTGRRNSGSSSSRRYEPIGPCISA